MEIKLDLRTILRMEEVINKLIHQDLDVPLSVGVKLIKLKEVLSECTEYAVKRMTELFPNSTCGIPNLSDEEKIIYGLILDTVVGIEVPVFEIDELEKCKNVTLGMDGISLLMNLCGRDNNQALDE